MSEMKKFKGEEAEINGIENAMHEYMMSWAAALFHMLKMDVLRPDFKEFAIKETVSVASLFRPITMFPNLTDESMRNIRLDVLSMFSTNQLRYIVGTTLVNFSPTGKEEDEQLYLYMEGFSGEAHKAVHMYPVVIENKRVGSGPCMELEYSEWGGKVLGDVFKDLTVTAKEGNTPPVAPSARS